VVVAALLIRRVVHLPFAWLFQDEPHLKSDILLPRHRGVGGRADGALRCVASAARAHALRDVVSLVAAPRQETTRPQTELVFNSPAPHNVGISRRNGWAGDGHQTACSYLNNTINENFMMLLADPFEERPGEEVGACSLCGVIEFDIVNRAQLFTLI
jgi:hypothetical protein